MIRSMTGFGRSIADFNNKQYSAEVRSVNGKQLDLNIRVPSEIKPIEPTLRKEVGPLIARGKSELSVSVNADKTSKLALLNKELLLHYYDQIKDAADELELQTDGMLSSLVRMPDVFAQEKPEVPSVEELEFILDLAKKATADFDSFRLAEGKKLEEDLTQNLNAILKLLERVEDLDPERNKAIRTRLSNRIKDLRDNPTFDENRFELEILYYMEKLDINEEKVRLRGHCNYFLEIMKSEQANGRKLGFIGQEMGREINTLGSKANHNEIQRLVVQMKDHLEKIKEQVLNVL